jgi:hypothetical protein
MKEIDPDGVVLRKCGQIKRRIMWDAGPNHTWSLDGQDKLMPYGFTKSKLGLAVHGCVDVASGYLIWLNVNITNHDPKVIALNYLRAVKLYNSNLYLT